MLKFFLKRIRTFRLTTWILISIIFGLGLGFFFPESASFLKPFQSLFLHGIKSALAPLIFASIITGVASAGSLREVGLMGVRTFVYFYAITFLALVIGLIAVNVFQPGIGIDLPRSEWVQNTLELTKTTISFGAFLERLIPLNIADAVVRGDVLQIVVFSLLFAFGVLSLGAKAKPVLDFSEALAQVMFRYIGYVMYLAPLGVAGALANLVAQSGLSVVLPLMKLVGSLYVALLAFVILVFYPLCYFLKIPLRRFIEAVKEPTLWAFVTSSSESVYSMALERMEQFGVPKRIVNFVLPMGYSFNLGGSTLYLSLASIFVAQVAGIDLSLEQQLMIMLTLMLTSKGVAAVPRASIVVLSGTLSTFGLPLEAVGLILGVDVFMDMGRSAINFLGNCLATLVIARWEGVRFRAGKTPD